MEGRDQGGRWRNLKQRLGFKGMGCCRATWSPTSSTLAILENHHDEEEEEEELDLVSNENANANANVNDVHQAPTTATGMNLAMALAAERNSRDENVNVGHPTTQVKTLMRLIEETDGVDWRKKRRKDKNNRNNNNNNITGVDDTNSNWVCCVCMERSKGAAFIPCGHTFCRVCSRELWLNRGSCPICNRSILEILDIF